MGNSKSRIICGSWGMTDITGGSIVTAGKKVVLLALFALCSVSAHAEAAIIDATTCSNNDVAQAISVAHAGDTVQIPAGTCTWTARLQINVGITVSGAGVDRTIL